jgi:hypothetical protein
VLALCDRWHKTPSQILAEPAEMVRLLRLEHLGTPEGGGDPDVE